MSTAIDARTIIRGRRGVLPQPANRAVGRESGMRTIVAGIPLWLSPFVAAVVRFVRPTRTGMRRTA
jgi:hypothetical protein